MIAFAVSLAIEDKSWDEIMEQTIDLYDEALREGNETFTASIAARLKLALEDAEKHQEDEEAYGQWRYDVSSCGTLTSEDGPTAVSNASDWSETTKRT